MKRTTLALPDDLATALAREAQRRSVSASQLMRDALSQYLGVGRSKRELPFIGLGSSGYKSTARDIDKLLTKEWGDEPRRVDTGPLYAAADDTDQDHKQSVAALSRDDLHLSDSRNRGSHVLHRSSTGVNG